MEEGFGTLLRLAARPRGAAGDIPSKQTEREIARADRILRQTGGRAVAATDPTCPRGLGSLPGGPPVVFLAGAWTHAGPKVAIVGARDATDDGCDVAGLLATELARHGVAVVSGLARGVDASAHRGALDAGGLSGAVLGTGLERAYPSEHRSLQEALAASLGILSALLPGSAPTARTFASRNRLLAAISDAVVVVQGRERSGALLTANAATRLGRPLGAVPWDSRDPLGAAPHALIRSGAATLVRDAFDVLELLGTRPALPRGGPPAPARDPGAGPALGDREERLLSALRDRPQPLESAASRASLSIAEAGASLVLLEILGLARREPGGAVRRRRRG